MNECLYCGLGFSMEVQIESGVFSCLKCGAPLPCVLTADGDPKIEAMQSVAGLMYRQEPPTFEGPIQRSYLTHEVNFLGAVVYFEIPNYGVLSWLGVTAEDKRVVRLRMIINACSILIDVPPLPLPLSVDIGLLDLSKVSRVSLEIFPAKTAQPTTYTLHYNRVGLEFK